MRVKLVSWCGFENRFQGHTSWQIINQPKAISNLAPLNSLGIIFLQHQTWDKKALRSHWPTSPGSTMHLSTGCECICNTFTSSTINLWSDYQVWLQDQWIFGKRSKKLPISRLSHRLFLPTQPIPVLCPCDAPHGEQSPTKLAREFPRFPHADSRNTI